MAERKSKPRKPEVDLDEEGKTEPLTLVSFLVGAIAIILGMILISTFLSATNTVYQVSLGIGFGACAVLTVVLFWLGRRKAAAA